MNFFEEAEQYQDTSRYNRDIWMRFREYVNKTPELKDHRDFVEKHVYGFGDRAFHWLWKLIVDELPDEFVFLEIGVYKGQVPSLIRLLADMTEKRATIYGITPLSPFSGVTGVHPKFPDTDYRQHIEDLHDHFGQQYPDIIHGDSNDAIVIGEAYLNKPYDVVYIDGCHEYNYVKNDLYQYPPMVRVGGFLVIDDASCSLNMWNGSFPGIADVSRATDEWKEANQENWKECFAVMHNRVFTRVR